MFLNIVAIYNTGAFENDSLEGTYLYRSFFKIIEKNYQKKRKKNRKKIKTRRKKSYQRWVVAVRLLLSQ